MLHYLHLLIIIVHDERPCGRHTCRAEPRGWRWLVMMEVETATENEGRAGFCHLPQDNLKAFCTMWTINFHQSLTDKLHSCRPEKEVCSR